MYSVVSLAIGVLLTGYYVLSFVGAIGPPHDEGGAIASIVLVFFLLIANIAGAVLGAFGLWLQEARRAALAGIVLNGWPWAIIIFGLVLGGC